MTPRLILINGAPASGKSTLARRYADDHPLTLNLDIDAVRGLLGDWLSDPSAAGRLARTMALAMARIVLDQGHDVVVPQLLGRPDFVLQLADLAREAGVPFAEIVLVVPPDEAESRFLRRTQSTAARESGSTPPAGTTHADNQTLLDRSGGLPQIAAYAAAIQQVVAERPNTHTITTHDGAVETAYRELLDRLPTR